MCDEKKIASWLYFELNNLRKNAESTTERQIEHLTCKIMNFMREYKEAL